MMIGRFLLVAGGGLAACVAAAAIVPAGLADKSALARVTAPAVAPAAIEAAVTTTAAVAPAAAAALPTTPGRIGINLTGVRYWSGDRSFANLMLGGAWFFRGTSAGGAAPQGGVSADGELTMIPAGALAMRVLTPPALRPEPLKIRCTYQGRGDVSVRGGSPQAVSGFAGGNGQLVFNWRHQTLDDIALLIVRTMDPRNPVRSIDCREADMASSARFDPRFLALMKRFKTARFMDWQNAMANPVVDWATRHTPASMDTTVADGVSIEDMIALSNTTGVEPWVTIPWNGTDAYIRGFAKLMHDGIPSNRPIYVELSNEVWNGSYPVARQAQQEGVREKLSANPAEAQLRRHAERTIQVMQIWEDVFRDRPRQLVRLIAFQHVVPDRALIGLEFPGLTQHIDAISSAPYFGYDVMSPAPSADLTTLFGRLERGVDASLEYARRYRVIAARYNKRYIAYEAGQHVVLPDNVPLLTAIQRDPRMYTLYKRYLQGWKRDIGDTIMVLRTAGPIGKTGAWGLVEYSGQPLALAPKMRAVLEETGS